MFVVWLLRIVFGALAAAAVVYSCRINMAALEAIGGNNAKFLGSIAVMTAAIKAAVPVYREYFGRQHRGLVALFVLALAFDGLCALGFAAVTRGAEAEKQEAANKNRAQLEERAATLENKIEALELTHRAAAREDAEAAVRKLQTLGPARRSTSAIKVELESRRLLSGNCGAQRAHLDVCQIVVKLDGELADAEAREAAELELTTARARLSEPPAATRAMVQELESVRTALKEAPAAGTADPFATSISRMAADAGVPLPVEWAGRGFTLLLVLFLELLAICGPAAAVMRLPAAPEPTKPLSVAPEPLHSEAKPAPKPRQRRASPVDANAVRSWLLAAQPAPDGWIYATQRHIAERAGCSAAAANAQLKELVLCGFIELRTGRGGTAIKVVSATQHMHA